MEYENAYPNGMIAEYASWLLDHPNHLQFEKLSNENLARQSPTSPNEVKLLRAERSKRTRLQNRADASPEMLETRQRLASNLLSIATLLRRTSIIKHSGKVLNKQWVMPQHEAQIILLKVGHLWCAKNRVSNSNFMKGLRQEFVNWDGTQDSSQLLGPHSKLKSSWNELVMVVWNDAGNTDNAKLIPPTKFTSRSDNFELSSTTQNYFLEREVQEIEKKRLKLDASGNSDQEIDSDDEERIEEYISYKANGYRHPNPFIPESLQDTYQYRYLCIDSCVMWFMHDPFNIMHNYKSHFHENFHNDLVNKNSLELGRHFVGMEPRMYKFSQPTTRKTVQKSVEAFTCEESVSVDHFVTGILGESKYPIGFHGPLVQTAIQFLNDLFHKGFPSSCDYIVYSYKLLATVLCERSLSSLVWTRKSSADKGGQFLSHQAAVVQNSFIVLESLVWLGVGFRSGVDPAHFGVVPTLTQKPDPQAVLNKVVAFSKDSLEKKDAEMLNHVLFHNLDSRISLKPLKNESFPVFHSTLLFKLLKLLRVDEMNHYLGRNVFWLVRDLFGPRESALLKIHGLYNLVFQRVSDLGPSTTNLQTYVQQIWRFFRAPGTSPNVFEMLALGFDFMTQRPVWVLEEYGLHNSPVTSDHQSPNLETIEDLQDELKRLLDANPELETLAKMATVFHTDFYQLYGVYRLVCRSQQIRPALLSPRVKVMLMYSFRDSCYGRTMFPDRCKRQAGNFNQHRSLTPSFWLTAEEYYKDSIADMGSYMMKMKTTDTSSTNLHLRFLFEFKNSFEVQHSGIETMLQMFELFLKTRRSLTDKTPENWSDVWRSAFHTETKISESNFQSFLGNRSVTKATPISKHLEDDVEKFYDSLMNDELEFL
ncbi:MAG: hypothetical protein ACTSUE_22745 [Promethearchaeota archaeon]